MHVIMLWINRYKALSTMLAVLAACLGAYQLQNLKIDTTSAGLIVQGSKDLNFYTEIKKEFGEDNSLTIIYKSDNIFTQEILQSIKNLSDEAEEIAGVTRVVSLATVNNLFITEEGYLNTDSLLPYIPEGEEELNKLRQTSLTHELIIGEVINRSGTVAAIQLSIKRYVKGSGFKDIDSIIKKLLVIERKRLNNKVIIYQISNATISDAMTDAIHSDLKLITPLALLLLSMVLLLFFRSGVAILLPIITGLLSVLVTLGLMSMLGYAINPISLTIPAFILIIGATEDIHILTEYELGIRTLQEKKSAIKQMAIRSGLVIFLTSVTTFAGFITLGPNSIPMISEFGIGAGLGIFANFIITILLAPALLHVLPVPDTFQKPEKKFLINITETLIHLSIKYQKKIFIGSIVFFVVSIAMAMNLKIDSNYLSFFHDDSSIRQLINNVNKDLSGTNAFYVIVDTHQADGLKKSDNLKAIAKLSDYLKESYGTIASYDRFIRKTHKELNGGSDKLFKVPDNDDLISQYTLLISPDSLERFADFKFQKACIVVRSEVFSSEQFKRDLVNIAAFAEQELPIHFTVTATGQAVLIAKAANQISREILINLAIMLSIIFLIISVLFSSIKAGLLAMIPNSFPIIGVFAAMSFLEIPLSPSTFSVVIIALGVAVDDTLHFMVSFSEECKKSLDNDYAIAQTMRHEIKPILGTSLALIVGFLALTPAEFVSVSELGLLSAITIFLALLADLIITPALLLTLPLISSWDLLSLTISQKVMDTSPIFKGLKPCEIKRFVLMGNIVKAQSGDFLMLQNDKEKFILLLLKGQLDIFVAGDDGVNKKVRQMEAGSIVGEMALLSGEPRSASVQAVGNVEVLEFDASTMQHISNRYPGMAVKIHQNFADILIKRFSV